MNKIEIGCAALYPITRFGFPYTVNDYLKSLVEMKKAGFKSVEMEINVDIDLPEYEERKNEIIDILKEQNLSLSGIVGVVEKAFSLNDEYSKDAFQKFTRLASFGKKMNCENLIICAYNPPEIENEPGSEEYQGSPRLNIRLPDNFDWDVFWINAVKTFKGLCKIAAKNDQKLIIENRIGDFISSSDGVLALIEQADEPNGGVLLDVAHANATKESMELIIAKLKNHIMYVHLSDNDGSSSAHMPAGEGNINFLNIFRRLTKIDYSGYANVDFGGVPPNKIWQEVKNGREYFEQCLDKIDRQ